MEHVWFRGNFDSWADARRSSTGYDAPHILDKVLAATREVIAGRAVWERDSVLFKRAEYSMPLLAGLLYAATRCKNRLSILDFGGSLGSTYWQHRALLGHLETFRWSIVEQPHFVEAGRSEITQSNLCFYESVGACVASESPNLALLSSVLPYLEHPYLALRIICAEQLPFVIVDRTPFFADDIPSRLTVESVPSSIYEGSYPAWIFNLREFYEVLETTGYSVVHDFASWERWSIEGDLAQSRCILLAAA
jgi:putative methyltransferase (TIGR04325 family)